MKSLRNGEKFERNCKKSGRNEKVRINEIKNEE